MDTLASYFFSGSPCPLDKKIMKIFNNYEKDKSERLLTKLCVRWCASTLIWTIMLMGRCYPHLNH